MSIYIVSYDLSSPEGDYSGVESALSQCAVGEMLHIQKSVWLLASPRTAIQIRDFVKDSLRTDDTLFVAMLNADGWAGWGTKAKAWIMEAQNR